MGKGPKGPFDKAAETSNAEAAFKKRFKNEAIRDLAYDVIGECEVRREEAKQEYHKNRDNIHDTFKNLRFNSPEFVKGQNEKLEKYRQDCIKTIELIDKEEHMDLSQLADRQYTLHLGPIKLLTHDPKVEEGEEVKEDVAPVPEADQAAPAAPSYLYDFNKAASPAADYTQEFNHAAQPEMDYPEQQL